MIEGPTRILLIEDNPADARLVEEMLKDAASEGASESLSKVVNAKRITEAARHLSAGSFDIILTDLDLPDSRGLDTFVKVRSLAPDVPVVVLTGLADEAAGVKAVKDGAQDYLVKGHVDGGVLMRSIRYAIERQRGSRAHRIGRAEKDIRPALDMVGASPRFKEVLSLISTVARTSRTSVLIHGETGTGKELVANSVHYLSERRDGPFIKLNCSAIPDALLEAEMFGYEKGAFTDAKQTKTGLFELAHGGTIFLDEIGDMDIRLQPKLLQVLENRTLRRVGGVKDIQVDVRVVAATNKDLESMVKEKRFREDLYYRLKVVVIDIPPLRERKEDIIPLSEHFMFETCRASGGVEKRLTEKSRELLLSYRWPGNVRELKNTIERAVILSASDEITPECLPQELIAASSPRAVSQAFVFSDNSTLEELEARYVLHILEKTGGNKTKAAEILGISRLTLREKLKKAGLGES